jgi:hypothetical protein
MPYCHLISDRASTDGESVEVTFREVGEKGLFIKNDNYLHFEVTSGDEIWVCCDSDWISNFKTVVHTW